LSTGPVLASIDSDGRQQSNDEEGSMSANKFEGSSLHRQQALQQFQRCRSDEVRRREGEQVQDGTCRETEAVVQGEKLEISDRARQLQDLRAAVEAGRAALDAEPEVRSDRVAEARHHLAAGVYRTAEAREVTADRLAGILEGLHRLLE